MADRATKVARRRGRKTRKRAKGKRQAARQPPVYLCQDCGGTKRLVRGGLFTPFRGMWQCDPCNARHLAAALELHRARGE